MLKAIKHNRRRFLGTATASIFTEMALMSTAHASFDNPDYVEVVIHSYRHRLGLAAGYPMYEELEQRLAAQPTITVPTITLDGDADGVVPATDGKSTAAKFSGKRQHRVIPNVGHNLPRKILKHSQLRFGNSHQRNVNGFSGAITLRRMALRKALSYAP